MKRALANILILFFAGYCFLSVPLVQAQPQQNAEGNYETMDEEGYYGDDEENYDWSAEDEDMMDNEMMDNEEMDDMNGMTEGNDMMKGRGY